MRKKVRLLDGREVKAWRKKRSIRFDTDCPGKYAVVDLETGEVYSPRVKQSPYFFDNVALGFNYVEASKETIDCLKKLTVDYEQITEERKNKEQELARLAQEQMWESYKKTFEAPYSIFTTDTSTSVIRENIMPVTPTSLYYDTYSTLSGRRAGRSGY